MPDELREGMPAPLYHAVDAVSASRLANIGARSAAYCRWNIDNESAPTEAQLRGIAAHAAILEPESLESRFVVLGQCCAETKNGRCRNQGSIVVLGQCYCRVRGHAPDSPAPDEDGRQPISSELWDECRSIRDAVLGHPVASSLLRRGVKRECSLFWTDRAWGTSLPCKARPDLLFGDGIGDVKVSRNAKPSRFPLECVNRAHHMRAAFYLSGARAVAEHARRYLFIAVEPDPPHEVCVYELHPDALEAGTNEAERAIRRYAECVRSGAWPGYPVEPQMVTLPEWYMKREFPELALSLTSGGKGIEW